MRPVEDPDAWPPMPRALAAAAEWSLLVVMAALIALPLTDRLAPRMQAAIETVHAWRVR